MYLLDTNIIIYTFQNHQRVKEMLSDLCQGEFYISVITRLESLQGYSKEGVSRQDIEDFLDCCVNFDIDKDLIDAAIDLSENSKRKLKFKDLIIAATAKKHKKILITSDKDFKNIPGVKVKYFPV